MQPVGSRPPTRSIPAWERRRVGSRPDQAASQQRRPGMVCAAGSGRQSSRCPPLQSPPSSRRHAGPPGCPKPLRGALTQRGAGQRGGGHILFLGQPRRLPHCVDERALARVLRAPEWRVRRAVRAFERQHRNPALDMSMPAWHACSGRSQRAGCKRCRPGAHTHLRAHHPNVAARAHRRLRPGRQMLRSGLGSSQARHAHHGWLRLPKLSCSGQDSASCQQHAPAGQPAARARPFPWCC